MKTSPLKCEILDDQLIISVGTNTLISAIESDWDKQIVNSDNFLKDLIRAMVREDADGNCPVTKLFNDSAKTAFVKEEKKEEDEWWVLDNKRKVHESQIL